MHANSRIVTSTQQGAHHKLPELLARHTRSPFQKPPAPYSVAALERLLAVWDGRTPLLLDAGCGTGASTHALARLHPEYFAVGVDQSEARLEQGARTLGHGPGNLLLLRADVVDIWLLLAQRGMRLARHYLLYPNPWPKAPQVMRRWPAHPIFPTLLGLGGVLECRSNWGIYTEEFAVAVRQLSGREVEPAAFVPEEPLTPFERKYRDSGHTLWRAAVDLEAPLAAAPEALSRAAP